MYDFMSRAELQACKTDEQELRSLSLLLQSIANVAARNMKQEETRAELSTRKMHPYNKDVSVSYS
jgi:hypothetical protein